MGDIEMYFLRNLCEFCLSNNKKFAPECNLSPNILDMIGYILPEYTLQNSEVSNKICENCLNSLKNIYNFRKKCLESIKTRKEYEKILKQKNESFKYPSIQMNEIQSNENREMESKTNLEEKIESELGEVESGTNNYNSKTDNNEKMPEQIVGKFELVEIRVKKEINEEIIIKEDLGEDSNLFENENPSNSENRKRTNQDKEDEYIPSDDSVELAVTINRRDFFPNEMISSNCNGIERNQTLTRKTRKRRSDSSEWACNIRKTKHDRGEEYISVRNKLVPAKKIVDSKDCVNSCIYKCGRNITQQERLRVFNSYYSLSAAQKRAFILSTTKIFIPARRRSGKTSNNSRKKVTYKYFFNVRGLEIQVCRNYYCGTLSISQKPIYTAYANKNVIDGTPLTSL